MLTPDSFRTARILAVQPHFSAKNLTEGAVGTSDPSIIGLLTNLVRLWGMNRKDLPSDFVDEVCVAEVERKPFWLIRHKAEILEMKFLRQERPLIGQNVDATPWPSKNPFDFIPIQPGRFPKELLVETEHVAGGQSAEQCSNCEGNGRNTCPGCEGGEVICPDCSGTQQISCQYCMGTGHNIGSRGQLIRCRRCQGRIYLRCRRCTRGMILCAICNGRGTVDCSRCETRGNLHVFYVVRKSTRTVEIVLKNEELMHNLDVSSLAPDLDVLGEAESIPLTTQETLAIAEVPLDVPAEQRHEMETYCKRELDKCKNSIGVNEAAIAVRIEIMGGYLYELDLHIGNDRKHIALAGRSNRVFCKSNSKTKGILNSLRKLHYNVMNAISGYQLPVDRTFLQAIQSGDAHIGDTRLLVPKSSRLIQNCKLSVTDKGYQLHFREQGYLPLDICMDLDQSGRQVLCLSGNVGRSERQKFSQALNLSDKLTFGRIGLSEDQEFFILEERKLYDILSEEHLAIIAKTIAYEASTVMTKGWLA